MVAKRMERQRVLYEHGKQVQVVMLEGALRTPVVSAPTLAGQLDRLLAISGLSSLELGIIPFEVTVPVFPLSGFRLYETLSSWNQSSESSSLRRPTTWRAMRSTWNCCARRRPGGVVAGDAVRMRQAGRLEPWPTDAVWTQTAGEQSRISSTDLYTASGLTC